MIERFEEALGQKGYMRLKSRPEWVHTFILPEGDPEKGTGARRAVICIDYRRDYLVSGGQIPLIRAKIREYFGMPIDQDRILVVIFTPDPERARVLSVENPYCWIVDEREERLILYENQPSDFDGMRNVAERLHMEREDGPEEEGQEAAGRRTWNGYNFQRRQSRWSLKEELQWIFLGQKKHFVTIGLVLINVLAYAYLSARGDLSQSHYMVSVGGMYPPLIIDKGEWWRLITSTFLHFDVSHLFNNMLILYFLGKWVEEALGAGRFAGVYLGSGILGAALSMYSCIVTGDMYVSAGASGAIYGLMGSLAVLILLHRGRFKGLSIQRMGFMLALCVYQSMTSMGIDTMGHLGGLISGVVLTMLLYGISYLAGWEN